MRPKITRPTLKRWSLFGLKVGLSLTIINFFVFFGLDAIREPTRELLGHGMKLLVTVPIVVSGLSLLAWIACFFWEYNSSDAS